MCEYTIIYVYILYIHCESRYKSAYSLSANKITNQDNC